MKNCLYIKSKATKKWLYGARILRIGWDYSIYKYVNSFYKDGFLLWFVFKILSLTYQKQLLEKEHVRDLGCDLLSKFYLWHIRNSESGSFNLGFPVVICFQNFIFDISETAVVAMYHSVPKLWFAFKILSLTYQKQPGNESLKQFVSCDLLSKFYLWHIRNSEQKATLLS